MSLFRINILFIGVVQDRLASADEQLVLVAFEAVLNEDWSGWEDAAPEELFDGVKEHGVNHYGFPEGRFHYRTPPAALEAVVARVAPEVDAVEWNPEHQLLVVEKLGETYAVAPDGTVRLCRPACLPTCLRLIPHL